MLFAVLHVTLLTEVFEFGMAGHTKGEEAHIQRNAEFSRQRGQLNVDSGAHSTEEDIGVSALLSSKPVRYDLSAAPVGQHMFDRQLQQCSEVQLMFDKFCSVTVVIYLLLQRKRRSGIQSGGNRALSAG